MTERRRSFCHSANGSRSLISICSWPGSSLRTVASAIQELALSRSRGRVGVKEQQRRPPGHARPQPAPLPGQLVLAGDGQVGDAEADRIGGLIARVLQEGDDIRHVLALDDAVADTAEDQRHRSRSAGAARQPETQQPEPAALQQPLEAGSMATARGDTADALAGAARRRRSAGGRAAARSGSAIERCVLDHPSHKLVKRNARVTPRARERARSRSCQVVC